MRGSLKFIGVAVDMSVIAPIHLKDTLQSMTVHLLLARYVSLSVIVRTILQDTLSIIMYDFHLSYNIVNCEVLNCCFIAFR